MVGKAIDAMDIMVKEMEAINAVSARSKVGT